jgi:hypothetical protein
MKPRTQLLSALLLTTLSLSGCKPKAEETVAATPEAASSDSMGAMATSQSGPIRYKVELIPLWTKANFPFEYPDTSLIHKPHFSGLIGTGHNADYHIFAEGQMPTPGLERLSEEGKHDPLSAEIQAAIAAGNALALSESEPLKDFSQTATIELTVDDVHPMASIVAMIAPSPDWFAGVGDLNLNEGGTWVATKTVDVNAWDSGGDDGTTFLADDKDNDPKKPTTLNKSRHFLKDGQPLPVARLTFTRL